MIFFHSITRIFNLVRIFNRSNQCFKSRLDVFKIITSTQETWSKLDTVPMEQEKKRWAILFSYFKFDVMLLSCLTKKAIEAPRAVPMNFYMNTQLTRERKKRKGYEKDTIYFTNCFQVTTAVKAQTRSRIRIRTTASQISSNEFLNLFV